MIAEGTPRDIQKTPKWFGCTWGTTRVRIRSLEAGYGGLGCSKSVSLHVNKGEIVGIIGANGAGKTTLLQQHRGRAQEVVGRIPWANGASCRACGRTAPSLAARAGAGGGTEVFSPMTVEENLDAWRVHALPEENQRPFLGARDLGTRLHPFPVLKQRKDQLAGTLSGANRDARRGPGADVRNRRSSCLTNRPWGLRRWWEGNPFHNQQAARRGRTILSGGAEFQGRAGQLRTAAMSWKPARS